MLVILGVCLLILSNKSNGKSIPASWAIAIRCNIVFVEPPIATSIIMAFSNASFLNMVLGSTFLRARLTISSPLSCAILSFFAEAAKAVPQPGRLMPMTSTRQLWVLAVYNPWQEPCPGQAHISISCASSGLISPFWTLPTSSNVSLTRDSLWPLYRPEIIGPAVTTMEGTLILASPISIPGVILSQLVRQTNPSKQWALITVSIESAISSLDASEYLIPVCPMAIPSHMPGIPKKNGTPPPAAIPLSTKRSSLLMPAWPGIISVKAVATAIKGLVISFLDIPVAYNNALCGILSGPRLIRSLLITSPL